MSLKNITCDKVNFKNIQCVAYLCEDMSVKHSEKTYCKAKAKDKHLIKDNPCFGYLQLYYYKVPQIYVTTPEMKCLFGIQGRGGDNFQMSLQFTNLQEDPIMQNFFDWIQNLEFLCMKYLGLDEKDSGRFISQIKYDKHKKYDPNLSVKIPFQYNHFQTDVYSDHASAINLLNIQGFTPMKCDIYLDKIWKMNDTFHCKWKCSGIHLI